MTDQIKKFEGEFAFLSNKHASTFYHLGVKYKTVSHAYYALRVKSELDAKKIISCKDVDEAIKQGKTFKSKDDWRIIAKETMRELLRKKFESPFLKEKLLSTKDLILGDERNFVGQLLMELREKLKNEKNDD